MPGKFRISATPVAGPIGLDLSEELQGDRRHRPRGPDPGPARRLARPPPRRRRRPRRQEPPWRWPGQPLPIDPTLLELRGRLAEASLPIPPDARLAQLRSDAAIGAEQVAARRLTAAQDIAWALINSPSFLFNH